MFCPGLVCHIAHLMYVLYLYIQDDLPETARQTKKRVLDLLLDENKERDKSNKDKKMNKRYKMVKFFGNEYIIVSLHL